MKRLNELLPDVIADLAAVRAGFQRVEVNISPESADILRRVKAERGWSTTQTIRVAIGLLDHAERHHRRDDAVSQAGDCGAMLAVSIDGATPRRFDCTCPAGHDGDHDNPAFWDAL